MHKADLRHSNQILQRKLEQIFALRRTRSAVNWDREKYLDLLQHFGNPHMQLPPVIHVAGTNGKGSIIAMLRAICEAEGLSVHSYISPHLVHINERIVLSGKQISDEMLEALIDEVMDYIGDAPLSFFEVTSTVAFKAFAQVPADILLLEVGMGGRLDCTNVVEKPLVSIINRISMDHTDFLGNTIEEIAAQKAGIIKSAVPCIVGYQGQGAQGDAILGVIQGRAKETDSELYIAGQDFSVSRNNNAKSMQFSYDGETKGYPVPALFGEHQCANAAVVLASLRQISSHGIKISEEAIVRGLQSCEWPGRMQRIDYQWPCDSGANSHENSHEIWLDCGHNDSAGEVLGMQMKRWKKEDSSPVFLVLGMLDTKDSAAFLEPMLDELSGIYVVPILHEPTSKKADEIKASCCGRVSVTEKNHFKDAVEEILNSAKEPPRILIAG
ncbi:MAG: bifunctional folylpolyglutamate synthase/dihydrofolate synthase, partial [Alphaproteobacteria bacterium]|nr:bifunctional folylpolyglutamate synthase/dihydrofolate synthase [Alphaproteobacteria bacterium]